MFTGYVLSQGYYNQSQGQSKDPSPESSNDMQVQVTGTTGISWRKKPSNVSEEDLQPEGGRDHYHWHIFTLMLIFCCAIPNCCVHDVALALY